MTIRNFLIVLLLFLSACKTSSVIQQSKFTSINNIIDLKINYTLNEVASTLGSKPQNVYSNQSEGYAIYTYNYKLIERKVNPKLINKPGGETTGTEVYAGKEHTLYLIFKNGRLESYATTNGRKDANPLVLMNNTLYTITNNRGDYVIIPVADNSIKDSKNGTSANLNTVADTSVVVIDNNKGSKQQPVKKIKTPRGPVYRPFAPGSIHLSLNGGVYPPSSTIVGSSLSAGIRAAYTFALNHQVTIGFNRRSFEEEYYSNDFGFYFDSKFNHNQIPINYRFNLGKRSIKLYAEAGGSIGVVNLESINSIKSISELDSKLSYGTTFGLGVNASVSNNLYLSLGLLNYYALNTPSYELDFATYPVDFSSSGALFSLTYIF
jgi:hypothetical protein